MLKHSILFMFVVFFVVVVYLNVGLFVLNLLVICWH